MIPEYESDRSMQKPCDPLQEAGGDRAEKTSSLIISEFVGCSPSMSGAIRVNPWDVKDVADGIHKAIIMPLAGRLLCLPPANISSKGMPKSFEIGSRVGPSIVGRSTLAHIAS